MFAACSALIVAMACTVSRMYHEYDVSFHVYVDVVYGVLFAEKGELCVGCMVWCDVVRFGMVRRY